jgi:putative transposase
MSTFIQIFYHIVFSTANREPVIRCEARDNLYKYIWGILENNKCHPYQIGGYADHLHILTHLHPTIALASLIKDIKVASSGFIKGQRIMPLFRNWQTGYAAFTFSNSDKDRLIQYVINQEEHHRKKSFREELIELLNEHGIPFDEKYLE